MGKNNKNQKTLENFENENVEKEANEKEKRSTHGAIVIGTMILNENTQCEKPHVEDHGSLLTFQRQSIGEGAEA